jgi:hypothetical protein
MTAVTMLEAFCRLAEANQSAIESGFLHEHDLGYEVPHADMCTLAAEVRKLQRWTVSVATPAVMSDADLIAFKALWGAASKGCDADGWIAWNGGAMPVLNGTLVDVRHRSGSEYHRQSAGFFFAYIWSHNSKPGDIVAYRPHRVNGKDA